MTEHKGLPVAGYKPQSDEKVALVNSFKQDEERILRKLDGLMGGDASGASVKVDGRWLAIGRTQLEQAFMAINRAVFQPGRVELPEDNASPPPIDTSRMIYRSAVHNNAWLYADNDERLSEAAIEAYKHVGRIG